MARKAFGDRCDVVVLGFIAHVVRQDRRPRAVYEALCALRTYSKPIHCPIALLKAVYREKRDKSTI